MVVKLSEMALSMTTIMGLVVCWACATVQGNNFPPVQGRFPIPSMAVKRPLVDTSGLLLSANQGLTGYPTQRWVFPPNVILSQVMDDAPISSDVPSQVPESDLPRQVGAVATPAPDGLPETDIADLPPEISFAQPDSRAGFVPLSVIPGKSQRPEGVPSPPLTVYQVFDWNPIDIPPDYLAGQGPVATDASSNQSSPPPPPSNPTTPPPLSLTDPSINPDPANPFWLGQTAISLPQGIQISNIPITQTTKSSKVIPIEPVLPSPIKGYAVSDIVRPPRKPQNIITLSSLNNFPGGNFAQPGFGYVPGNYPYPNSYVAAMSGYSPPPPDRVRGSPNADTVTLSNAYGDLWVLKRDGPRPYFERIKLSVPAPALPYGTVSSPSSAKSDLLVIKKEPKVGRLIPQKTIANVRPLNIGAPPIPAASVSQPCNNKQTPVPIRKPVSAPVRAIRFSGKGNPYPGPITAISPYSYIAWNPKSRAYMYSVPGAKQTPNAAVVAAAPAPRQAKVVKSIPRLVNLNGYWRPITLPNESNFNVPPVNPSRLQAQLQSSTEIQFAPQSSVESTADYSSAEPSSTSSSLSTSLPTSEPVSDDSSSSSEPVKLESLISSVTALREDTPISRIAEEDTSKQIEMESIVSSKPDPGRYRSYVFRYDYQNDPQNPSDRFARIIPVAFRTPALDSAGGDPFKFHKAVSYVFSEGDINSSVTPGVPPTSSSESAVPLEALSTTSVDAQPSSSEESSNVVRSEETP